MRQKKVRPWALLWVIPVVVWGQAPVQLATVQQEKVSRTLRLPGELLPYQVIDVVPKVAGFVEDIPVDRGTVVQAGELLARLSAPELVAQLREAEAGLLGARAEQLRAQAGLAAARKMLEQLEQAAARARGAVAELQLVQARRDLETAQAVFEAATTSVKAAEARVEQLRELASYLEVHAPFDGIISDRYVHPGALVGPGVQPPRPLVRLQQTRRLRLVLSVPEREVAHTKPGDWVEFSVKAYPGRRFGGKVARLGHSLDTQTRAMPVELDVDNGRSELAPGMYAEVRWPVTHPAALVVPRTAVVRTTERQFVIRVRNNRAEWVDVETGERAGDRMEVFGELKPSDQVVLRATDEIRPGSVVSVQVD